MLHACVKCADAKANALLPDVDDEATGSDVEGTTNFEADFGDLVDDDVAIVIASSSVTFPRLRKMSNV